MPELPKGAYLPINRCNMPARILGGLTFQTHPQPLRIDNVHQLYADLFTRLDGLADTQLWSRQFIDYMDVRFALHQPEQAGYQAGGRGRPKATWQRILRGWFFDPDGREGAVLKAWVESRFGLLPRFHRAPIRDFSDPVYRGYLEDRALGLYNTNALEAQLDLVYSFCQYQLANTVDTHLTLYRGVNKVEQLECFPEQAGGRIVVLLNNLNSFSRDLERASEFGDRVMAIQVPREKVFCFDLLFPGQLNGEGEYMVIGGLYAIGDWVY